MTLDWSINIGQIFTAIGLIWAMITAYYVIKSDIRQIEGRLSSIEEVVKDRPAADAKIAAEIASIHQLVAVIKDRLEPPPIAVPPYPPTKGA